MEILSFNQFKNSSFVFEAANPLVSAVQTALKAKGYGSLLGTTGPNKDGVDGELGPNTNAAIKKFQRDNGLVDDGIVGSNTAAKLGVQPLSGVAAKSLPPIAYAGGKTPSATMTTGFNPTPAAIKPTSQTEPAKASKKSSTKLGSPMQKIIVSDSLAKMNIHFDSTKETKPIKCDENGCAQWVSNTLDDIGIKRQGNAWHAHGIDSNDITFTVFKNFDQRKLAEMGSLFTLINASYKNPQVAEKRVKSLLTSLVPDQNQIKKLLTINSIVGLYYDNSTNYTRAFFEGATGYDDMGKAAKVTNGPYFYTKSNKVPWSQSDLGKNIEFVAGNTLTSGGGFGFNTHLGFVGAIADGEPIIFHNIHNTIHSTPFKSMKNVKVMWIKSTNDKSVVREEPASGQMSKTA